MRSGDDQIASFHSPSQPRMRGSFKESQTSSLDPLPQCVDNGAKLGQGRYSPKA